VGDNSSKGAKSATRPVLYAFPRFQKRVDPWDFCRGGAQTGRVNATATGRITPLMGITHDTSPGQGVGVGRGLKVCDLGTQTRTVFIFSPRRKTRAGGPPPKRSET